MDAHKMTLDQYQDEAVSIAGEIDSSIDALMRGVLGLCGESGELADTVKKTLFHNRPYDEAKLLEEMGDILWYLAVLTNDLGYGLGTLAARNLYKLQARYPEGFSYDASLHRPPVSYVGSSTPSRLYPAEGELVDKRGVAIQDAGPGEKGCGPGPLYDTDLDNGKEGRVRSGGEGGGG